MDSFASLKSPTPRARTEGGANILLVDDDPSVITVLSRMLLEFGRLRFATSAADALRIARDAPPDLVLLDVEMADRSGFEVCAEMKEDPLLADVPVIFVTSHNAEEQEVMGLSLGAVDFIAKPPRAPVVIARVRTQLRLKKMADALREAAVTDPLTGVANRRQFEQVLGREWLRGLRVGSPIALLLVDVDAFKAYNDHYGHPGGDQCLIDLAHGMRKVVHRPADLMARYGGEEFIILLPETDANGARSVAREIIRAIDALQISHAASPVASHVTVSVGVATLAPRNRSAELIAEARDGKTCPERLPADLVALADQALYEAKHAGRHQFRYIDLTFSGCHGRAAAMELAANGARS